MGHISSIHQLLLCCLYLLATVNDAVMNMMYKYLSEPPLSILFGVCVCFCVCVCVYPEVE